MEGLSEIIFSNLNVGLNSAADAFKLHVFQIRELLQQTTIHAGLAWKSFVADIEVVFTLINKQVNVLIEKNYLLNQIFDAPYGEALVVFVASTTFFIWLLMKRHRSFDRQKIYQSEDLPPTFDQVSSDAARDKQRQREESAEQYKMEPLEAGNRQSELGTYPIHSKGFKFFKKKNGSDEERNHARQEDDVFLLGLEQEMLATRQLYLDGFISKQVYVNETKSLYEKAKSRMT
ncbi:MAG: hypothetical protein ACPIEU_03745 [Candidatus Puniceispirillaceae bacterium]